MNIEAKKKYEFLESFSAIMDAHLRYFKLGYDLLKQLEPFIHEVLTYAQQSKQQATIEQDRLGKRIQEFRTQAEINHMQASNNFGTSPKSLGINGVGMSSYRNIGDVMLSTAKGEVHTIKQGYLLKRSSSLRADWKRRFFVLDSLGALYYYRHKGAKPIESHSFHPTIAEHNSRMFSRFRSRHHRSSSFSEESLGCRTVDLRTSTIKIDAEDTDLRLCFRIISPLKTYTLQAENEADRLDWMKKITGVIASLLNTHLQQVELDPGKIGTKENYDGSNANYSFQLNKTGSSNDRVRTDKAESVSQILREIPGNDKCAECGAPEPDWASLNLGILMCIECSGIHRNLGVHISKVRSITLDVRVWEPTVLDLFRTLGNVYCNSVWEELLPLQDDKRASSLTSVVKPSPKDAIHQKEKYILIKYVQKLLVNKEAAPTGSSLATSIWEAVRSNNIREVYQLIAASDVNTVNCTYDEVAGANNRHDVHEGGSQKGCHKVKSPKEPGYCLQGCSLLHLSCHSGYPVMVELLLQFGADINKCDFHGRTPLLHCISEGNNELAKFLLRRGARASIKDDAGLTALERAMEMGAITDEELFVLLAGSD